MIYHCKFGEFGILGGQFTEPSGVAVTPDNEIVVADTNNHRIQVFDKEGNFKFQFGEVGKRDGQLLYPNRVAVVASSGSLGPIYFNTQGVSPPTVGAESSSLSVKSC